MSIGWATSYEETVLVLDALKAHGGDVAEMLVEYVIQKAGSHKAVDDSSRRIYLERERWLSPG